MVAPRSLKKGTTTAWNGTDLDIISLVIVATLPEKTVVDHIVDIQLIEQRVTVLKGGG